MKRNMIKWLTCGLLVVLLIAALPLSAGARNQTGTPNEIYTHWDTYTSKKTVFSRPMYEVETVVGNHTLTIEPVEEEEDEEDLDDTEETTDTVDKAETVAPDVPVTNDVTLLTEPLENIVDLKVYKDQVYLLSPDSSQITVLDKNLKLVRQFGLTDAEGAEVTFEDARGFYIGDERIYVADTEGGRVIIADMNGVMERELTLPPTELIPDDFQFRPMKMVLDIDRNLYVLSEGSFYGAIIYSEEYEFVGFYGANTVKSTVLDALGKLWDMIFTTNSKRAATERALPFQFINLCADKEGFIYTVTGSTSAYSTGQGQIRRLSPGGANILMKQYIDDAADSNQFNFLEEEYMERLEKRQVQNLCSIDVNDQGFMYALDSSFGRVYIYDQDCNLLTTFGGGLDGGKQQGSYIGASALALLGDRLLVLDTAKSTVTSYKPTAYGNQVLEAQALTLEGEYEQAKPIWQSVLSQDRNNRLAYSGLAKAAYIEGEYESAMHYAEWAMDKVTYDQSFSVVRQEFINDNFLWLFPIGLVVVVGLVVFMVLSRKREIVLVRNVKVRTMYNSVMHPFRAFDDVKTKKQGSVWLALIITVLFYIVSVLRETKSGFLFSTFDVSEFNSIFVLLRTVGLILLFSIANWGITSLMEGKGRLNEVFIVTAYSMIPLVLEGVVYLIMSQFMGLSGGTFFTALHWVALFFTAFMLIVGLMVIHDYGFVKWLGTMVITVVGIILIVFLLFILGILLSQFVEFIVQLYEEVAYR